MSTKMIYVYDGPGEDATLLATVPEGEDFAVDSPAVWLRPEPI